MMILYVYKFRRTVVDEDDEDDEDDIKFLSECHEKLDMRHKIQTKILKLI